MFSLLNDKSIKVLFQKIPVQKDNDSDPGSEFLNTGINLWQHG